MNSGQQDVQQLFGLVAPERISELTELLARYSIGYERVHDRPGVFIQTWDRVVLYNDRVVRLAYLTAALAWRALVEQSGAIIEFLRRGEPYDCAKLARDPRYRDLEGKLVFLADAIAQLRQVESVDLAPWPKDIPIPDPKTGAESFPNTEDKAAYQTAVRASGWMLLHETRHAMYAVDGDGPGGLQEEYDCDDFASRFLLDRTSVASEASGRPEWQIRSHRAIGILLAQSFIVEMTPESRWAIAGEHPPVKERIIATLERLNLPAHDDAYVFASAVLLGQLRRAGRHLAEIPFTSPMELYRALVARL